MFFITGSKSADCNFIQLFGFWRRSPIWLVIDFFSTSCHSQLLLVVTAKIMFYVDILPFTWKRIEWENGKEISISNWLFCREYEMYLPCMVSIFWTLEVRGWISFLSSGNFELQVFLLTYCHLEPALNKPFCTLLFTLHLKGRPGPDHGHLDQDEVHTCPLTIWCEMCALNGLPTRCMQPSDSPFPVALPSTRKHRSWSSISSFESYNDCLNISFVQTLIAIGVEMSETAARPRRNCEEVSNSTKIDINAEDFLWFQCQFEMSIYVRTWRRKYVFLKKVELHRWSFDDFHLELGPPSLTSTT